MLHITDKKATQAAAAAKNIAKKENLATAPPSSSNPQKVRPAPTNRTSQPNTRRRIGTFDSINLRVKRGAILIHELLAKRKAVELMAMKIVIERERSCGRTVDDVSSHNLGFDLVSRCSDKPARQIEVKGLSQQSGVTLTANEVRAAKEFGDTYWLYVVTNCSKANETELYRIQNPAQLEMVSQVVLYEIDWVDQQAHATETHKLAG